MENHAGFVPPGLPANPGTMLNGNFQNPSLGARGVKAEFRMDENTAGLQRVGSRKGSAKQHSGIDIMNSTTQDHADAKVVDKGAQKPRPGVLAMDPPTEDELALIAM